MGGGIKTEVHNVVSLVYIGRFRVFHHRPRGCNCICISAGTALKKPDFEIDSEHN